MEEEWNKWRDSLQDLQELQIPRTYTSSSTSNAQLKELCVFADASVKASAAVAYLKVTTQDEKVKSALSLERPRWFPSQGLLSPD